MDDPFESFLATGEHDGRDLYANYGKIHVFYNQVDVLETQGLLPTNYSWQDYLWDFLKAGMQNAFKNQDITKLKTITKCPRVHLAIKSTHTLQSIRNRNQRGSLT